MKYIAVLDFDHLDNALFLTAFAKSLGAHKDRQGIILHGDSNYTDRLIQTGMMREDAEIRAIKDLNRRLVALLADHGISTIGMNGYQKEMILRTESRLAVNTNRIDDLPKTPFLLLSTLVKDSSGAIYNAGVEAVAKALGNAYEDHDVILFSMDDSDELIKENGRAKQISAKELDDSFKLRYIPKEFHNYDSNYTISTPSDFSLWPNLASETQVKMLHE